jgi:hypothetical protein
MLFLGVDWGERHHDLCLLDQTAACSPPTGSTMGWPG